MLLKFLNMKKIMIGIGTELNYINKYLKKLFFIWKDSIQVIHFYFYLIMQLQNGQPSSKTRTTRWLKGMLSVNKKSHVIRHVLTLRILNAPKKLCFWQNCEEVFNWLNSVSELSCTKATCRDHGVKSRAEITCRDHVQGSRAGVTCRGHMQRVCKLPGVICIYKWVEL